MNSIPSAAPPLFRAAVRVDRSQISYVTALRNALGVAAPLLVGVATGQLLAGLTVSLGALQVAFLDGPEPYRDRARRMLAAGVCSAISVFVGSATGSLAGLAVLLAALWGFGGGLLVALGQAATQIGLSSVVLLLVFGARPAAPGQAALQAGLVLAGAVLQTALAVAAWPVRPFGPQRAALSAAFERLAATTRTPPDPRGAPPATDEITNARLTLAGSGGATSATGEVLRALLDETERIRLELLALDDARDRLSRTDGSDGPLAHVTAALGAAGEVLDALAGALHRGELAPDAAPALQRIDQAARALQPSPDANRGAAVAVARAHVEALAGQLRAAVEYAGRDTTTGEAAAARQEALRPMHLRLREPLAILRANLTLRSAACRHATRLAVAVAFADAVTRLVNLPRAYWVPMTLAIILKPDFGATFSRGLGRLAGTALGLGVATLLVYAVFGDLVARIFLLGLLMFVMRSLGRANYGLFVVALTALVVVLTSFAGVRPETAIVERGVDTLIGGVLALAAYALWPTWEYTQAPGLVADLLDAYRAYVAAVMAGYLDPQHADPARRGATRLAARLARSNAEASVARLRDEPARSGDEVDRLSGVLANSHRIAHAAMSLEAGLYHVSRAPQTDALRVFAADVDTVLCRDAQALRNGTYPPPDMVSLRSDQRTIVADMRSAAGGEPHGSEPIDGDGYPAALLAAETDRLTDSINTITAILRPEKERERDEERGAGRGDAGVGGHKSRRSGR